MNKNNAQTKYELYKLVDDEWWIHGTYDDVFTLVNASYCLGLEDYDGVKVVVIRK